MAISPWDFSNRHASIVGSIGDTAMMASLDASYAAGACDLLELRLDLLGERVRPTDWEHLREMPLLMTARREDEGGAKGLGDARRIELLETALPDAAMVDLEVASIGMATDLIRKLAASGTPWVASFHDFCGMPDLGELREKVAAAREAGAAAFKAAAMICEPGDLARLADFQLENHGMPVATMGMGPMAVVSRLLCAQCGSVLNYGYLGETPTAPGQWSATEMKSAIQRLPVIGSPA
jgi:3-dehydroquinate dehydratase-1